MKKSKVIFGDPKIKPKKVNKAKLLKKYKKELWELCKIYCRKKWGNTCYTCGAKNLYGCNQQTGHFIPSCLCPFELDYHPDNLRIQCMRCNKWAGGNQSQYAENLKMDYGQFYIDILFEMKNQPKITKPSLEDYENYIEKYKQLIKKL